MVGTLRGLYPYELTPPTFRRAVTGRPVPRCGYGALRDKSLKVGRSGRAGKAIRQPSPTSILTPLTPILRRYDVSLPVTTLLMVN